MHQSLTGCPSNETIRLLKPAIFHAAALRVIRSFPDEVRRVIGQTILDLQHGALIGMPLSRPMPSVASGVAELRIRERDGSYRVFYYAKSAAGVLILHAFTKKTQQTPGSEIAMARRRLKELLDETV